MMTINKDGSVRKARVNPPTNFKWTEEYALIAYYCYKADAKKWLIDRIEEKLGVSSSAFRARMNEFQILDKNADPSRVTTLSKKIVENHNMLTPAECEQKLLIFIGNERIEESCDPEKIFNDASPIKLIETNQLISEFLKSGIVDFNGPFINSENLIPLISSASLDILEKGMEGCYFIFSNIPEEKIPVLSKDGLKGYQKFLEKDGVQYRCLYNGKGNDIKERLKLHLFNPFTLEKIKNDPEKTLCGTGAMSLDSHPIEIFNQLEKVGKFIPAKHKLKPVEKSIQECSIDKREGHAYFLNGIDILEKPWSGYKFALIVLRSDSEFGKILIEEAFCVQNGRPPLCKRHG